MEFSLAAGSAQDSPSLSPWSYPCSPWSRRATHSSPCVPAAALTPGAGPAGAGVAGAEWTGTPRLYLRGAHPQRTGGAGTWRAPGTQQGEETHRGAGVAEPRLAIRARG
jgi:hypothetical protein